MGLFYWLFKSFRFTPNMIDFDALFSPVLASMGYELVGVEFSPGRHHGLLRIYIDHDNGITVDDCAKVSHQVSALMDVENPIAGSYDLEVSSPGVDRPLFKPAHYQKYSGQRCRIKLSSALQGRRNFTGLIVSADESEVVLDVDHEHFHLPFGLIGKAHLIAEI